MIAKRLQTMPISLLSFVDAKRASECRRLVDTAMEFRHESVLEQLALRPSFHHPLGGLNFAALLRDGEDQLWAIK
jgi:hypothetical protein